jgi:hypothetical protein
MALPSPLYDPVNYMTMDVLQIMEMAASGNYC